MTRAVLGAIVFGCSIYGGCLIFRRGPAVLGSGATVSLPAFASNFPYALAALYEEHHICRRGWRNKFHLAAESFPGLSEVGEPGPLVIVRVNADGSKWPWTPTEDDMFANDWGSPHDETMFVNGGPDHPEMSFAWAVYEVHSGRDVFIGDGPLRLTLGETHGGCIDLVLPNGDRRLWRPQHQDLWGVYRAA